MTQARVRERTRVTRLDEFWPIRQLFVLGSFFNIT
jgi:hypothetical protein